MPLSRSDSNTARDHTRPRKEQFTFLHSITVIICTFFLILSAADRKYDFLSPWVEIFAFSVFYTLIYLFIISVYQRKWRQILSIAISPVLTVAILFACADRGFDFLWLRFELKRGFYETMIKSMKDRESAPLLKVFDMGDSGLSGFIHDVVFDESDEIALPALQRSERWAERAGRERVDFILQNEGYGAFVRNMGHHFYIIRRSNF